MFNDYYRGKKVLVTGHTGFKGSWLVQWLDLLGAKVFGISDKVRQHPSLFELAKIEENCDSHFLDIRSYVELRACIAEIQPEIVFHLAAEAIVRDCYDHPQRAFDTNLMGTVNVLEAARTVESIQQILVVTTDKCYENDDAVYAFKESDRLGGKDPYSASKACAEIATRAYAKSYFESQGVFIGTARAGNVIGGGDWSANRLICDVIRSVKTKSPLVIRMPKAVRPWQHVLDPLGGYLSFLANKASSAEFMALNFGPSIGLGRTVEDVLNRAQKHFSGFSYIVDGAGVGAKKEANYLELDCTRAEQVLGWRAKLSFEEAIDWTFAWYSHWLADESANHKVFNDITISQITSYLEMDNPMGLTYKAMDAEP